MSENGLYSINATGIGFAPHDLTRGADPAAGRLTTPGKVTLVVPCFNEETRLPVSTLDQFAAEHADVKFVFVNDGSNDATGDLMARMRAANPEAFGILDLGENRGKGEAVRQGVLRALETGPDFVGYWDADLATPLEVLSEFRLLLDRCPEVDLVMGSRVPLLGRAVDRRPFRQIGARMFATAAALVLGVSVYDTQCGAKLLRVTSRTHSLFDRPFRSRWAFDVELLARLLASRGGPSTGKMHLYEFPLQQWSDVAGSKMRSWHMIQAVIDLACLFLRN
jgi:dolichyl-phosphate beta-glucosyltransferase